MTTCLTLCCNSACGNALKEKFHGCIRLCVVCDGTVAGPIYMVDSDAKRCSKEGCNNLLKKEFQTKEFRDQNVLCVVCCKTAEKRIATHDTKTCSKDGCKNRLKKEFQGQRKLCVICDRTPWNNLLKKLFRLKLFLEKVITKLLGTPWNNLLMKLFLEKVITKLLGKTSPTYKVNHDTKRCSKKFCNNLLKKKFQTKEFQGQDVLCTAHCKKIAKSIATHDTKKCSKEGCNNLLKKEFQGQRKLCVICDEIVAKTKPARIATRGTRTCSKKGCTNLLKTCYPAEATKCRLHKTYFAYTVMSPNPMQCNLCKEKVGSTMKQYSSHYHNRHVVKQITQTDIVYHNLEPVLRKDITNIVISLLI